MEFFNRNPSLEGADGLALIGSRLLGLTQRLDASAKGEPQKGKEWKRRHDTLRKHHSSWNNVTNPKPQGGFPPGNIRTTITTEGISFLGTEGLTLIHSLLIVDLYSHSRC